MRRVLLLAVVVLALGATGAEAGTPYSPQTRSAKQVYVSTWKAVHHYFAAPLYPPPRLVRDHSHQPGFLAFTGRDNGYRTIHVGDGFWEVMAGGRRRVSDLALARESLIHEFAHIYQDDPVFLGQVAFMPFRHHGWYWSASDSTFYEGAREGTAEAFALWVARRVYGPSRAYHRGGGYSEYVEEMRRDLPASYLRHGQFAEHSGTSARAVPFP